MFSKGSNKICSVNESQIASVALYQNDLLCLSVSTKYILTESE